MKVSFCLSFVFTFPSSTFQNLRFLTFARGKEVEFWRRKCTAELLSPRSDSQGGEVAPQSCTFVKNAGASSLGQLSSVASFVVTSEPGFFQCERSWKFNALIWYILVLFFIYNLKTQTMFILLLRIFVPLLGVKAEENKTKKWFYFQYYAQEELLYSFLAPSCIQHATICIKHNCPSWADERKSRLCLALKLSASL